MLICLISPLEMIVRNKIIKLKNLYKLISLYYIEQVTLTFTSNKVPDKL